jgi:hypothetical protein
MTGKAALAADERVSSSMEPPRLLLIAVDSIRANYGKPVGKFRGQKKERTEARSF